MLAAGDFFFGTDLSEMTAFGFSAVLLAVGFVVAREVGVVVEGAVEVEAVMTRGLLAFFVSSFFAHLQVPSGCSTLTLMVPSGMRTFLVLGAAGASWGQDGADGLQSILGNITKLEERLEYLDEERGKGEKGHD